MRPARILPPLAAVVLGCLLLSFPGSAAGAPRQVPYGFYGMIYAGQIEDAPTQVSDRAWNALAAAGVESVRAVFNWAQTQPDPAGPMSWERSDSIVRSAATRRISVMPTIEVAPAWARQYPDLVNSPPADGAGFAAYARFATELVRRYGPRGSFWSAHPRLPRRPIRAWQILNEPELTDWWWRTGPWAPQESRRYGRLLAGAYRAIHASDPGSKVVLGGLTNFSWDDLATLYRDGGIRGHFDVAAVHLFPGDWRDVTVIVDRFRAVLDRNGSRRVPIWATEMSWPSSLGRAHVPSWADTPYLRRWSTTERGKASRLAQAYRLLAGRSFRVRNRLQRVFWYLATSSFRGDYVWDYSGVMQLSGSSLTMTAAYQGYRAEARRGEGCRKTSVGACR